MLIPVLNGRGGLEAQPIQGHQPARKNLTRRRRLVVGAVSLFVVPWILGGCGQDERMESELHSRSSEEAATGGRLIAARPMPKGLHLRSACRRAEVTVGKAPSEIEVAARCSAPEGGEGVNFTISRFIGGEPLEGARVSGVAAVPVVSARGEGGGRLRCRLVREWARCSGQVRGTVRVDTSVSVDSETRCEAGVAIHTTVVVCKGKGCGGTHPPPTTFELFRGMPRGC